MFCYQGHFVFYSYRRLSALVANRHLKEEKTATCCFKKAPKLPITESKLPLTGPKLPLTVNGNLGTVNGNLGALKKHSNWLLL